MQEITAAYSVQEHWVEMPMAEYIAGYRDFGRVRGYISLLATKIVPTEGMVLTPETADKIIHRERERLDRMLLKMEREAAVPAHTARAFFAGTCLLCPPEHCTRREGRPCRHPESIRPSLEALGFDIARTAADIFHTPLQWGRNGQPPEYITLISGFARKF